MKCTQRLYLTADRKKLVEEGHKKAASLYAVPGDEIPPSAHELFGLVDGHLKGFDPDAGKKADDDSDPAAPEPKIAAAQVLHHSTETPGKLVAADDPAAGKVYAKVGDLIPQSAHDGFGLVEGALPPAKEDKGGADKEQKGGSDKEQKPDAGKTESGGGAAGAVGEVTA